jgi:hypothetical protein
MTQAVRNAAIIALVFLVGACVKVGHIQQTSPIRTMQFTGSHKSVAQCIHQRLGGRVQDDSFGEKYVIYNSVKGRQQEGLTHYAITVGKIGPDQGFAEWRIMRPSTSGGPASARPSIPPLTDAVVREYWNPVEDCAARAKASS